MRARSFYRTAATVLMAAASAAARADDDPHPPRGLFCSCPPTTASGDSVLEPVATLPFVDGVLVRIGWDLVAATPDPGAWDWSRIDDQLARAAQFDVDIALAVVIGRHAPDWLASAGAAYVDFEFMGETFSIPAAWDPVFLAHWSSFIAALGERYDGHPRIRIVHMTNASANGFEMQLQGAERDWAAAGYTPEAYASSWMTVVDAFDAAFPNTPLDVEVHPVFNEDAVAQQVVQHAQNVIGPRFGVFAAWWTQHNAQDVYPGMYQLLAGAACDTFGTVQVARSETVHGPAIFGDGGLAGALDLALAANVGYAEVWNADLLNPELQPMLAEKAMRLNEMRAADVNVDGAVDAADLALVLASWGPCPPDPACPTDVDCDGATDASDLAALLAGWDG